VERGKQFRLLKQSSWGDLLPVKTIYEAPSASDAQPKATVDQAQNTEMDDDMEDEDDSDYEDFESDDERGNTETERDVKIIKEAKGDGKE